VGGWAGSKRSLPPGKYSAYLFNISLASVDGCSISDGTVVDEVLNVRRVERATLFNERGPDRSGRLPVCRNKRRSSSSVLFIITADMVARIFSFAMGSRLHALYRLRILRGAEQEKGDSISRTAGARRGASGRKEHRQHALAGTGDVTIRNVATLHRAVARVGI